MGTPLKNPPVYYTVAQVRFNQLLKLSEYAPAIQESFRKAGFPDSKSGEIQALEVTVDGGQVRPVARVMQRYTFGNVDSTHSFVLQEESLALQSTRYGTFEDFTSQLLDGIAIVHGIVQLALTTRIGVRYLDRVVPRPGERIEDFLVSTVLGLGDGLEGTVVHRYSETRATTGAVTLIARVLIREGALWFPPDLAPVDLTVNKRFTEYSGINAVLDTDGFVESRSAFDLANIRDQLSSIHSVISAAFKATATPHAFKAWGE